MLLVSVLVGVLLFASFLVIIGYNRLIRLRNRMREGWSGVEVQLKRRHDLIPNLVRVVQAYQIHERQTLEEVTRLRSEAQAAGTVAEASTAEGGLKRSLEKLVLRVEDYPELKADSNFRKLMDDLVEVEDALQYARRYYNGAVRDLNNGLESFPLNIVGNIAKFKRGVFFEASEDEKKSVKVEL